MGSVIYSEKVRAIADEIQENEAALRVFVLARAVEIAKEQNDSQGVKCLELIARLALGDRPPSGNDYTNQSGMDFSNLSREELIAVQDAAQRMIDWTLQERSNGSNGSHPATE